MLGPSEANPQASLGISDFDITLTEGIQFTVQGRCATDWLRILLDPDFATEHILPGMLSEPDARELERIVEDKPDIVEEIVDLSTDLIEAATGRPAWFTIRLLGYISNNWARCNGALVMAGVDCTTISFGAYLDAMEFILAPLLSPEQRRHLAMPPVGWEQDIDWESEEQGFMAMMNQ